MSLRLQLRLLVFLPEVVVVAAARVPDQQQQQQEGGRWSML
jgi:hypothetical protein